MAVNLSPLGPSPQFVLSSGLPAVGGRLFFYVAGSVGNNKQNTYTDSTGTVPNANPVVLDTLGMPTTQLWFTDNLLYKVVYAPPGTDDPPTSPIRTWDYLSGINDVTATASEWQPFGLTPTYVDATHFTLVGDQLTTFQTGRKIQTSITAGTGYQTVVNSSLAIGVTTVTVSGTPLDSGLSAVSYALLSATNPSVPTITRIDDLNGNEVVKFGQTASAVNEITVTNAATANSPSIVATGTDTNISLNIGTTGTGNIDLTTGGGSLIQASIRHTVGATRYVTITGSNGGNSSIGTSAGGLVLAPTQVFTPNIGTTASAANLFVDNANSNEFLRSTSSLQYKTDIRKITPQMIEAAMKLNGFTYRSKAKADDKRRRHIGCAAEDAHEKIPMLVNYGPDGKPDGFQYERLTVLLLEKVKLLDAEIKRLKRK